MSSVVAHTARSRTFCHQRLLQNFLDGIHYIELLCINHGEKHPIIFLKDVRYAELKALVSYMYRGEVNILQDDLPSLLKVAEALQIRGLFEISNEVSSDSNGDIQETTLEESNLVPLNDSRDNITKTTNSGESFQPVQNITSILEPNVSLGIQSNTTGHILTTIPIASNSNNSVSSPSVVSKAASTECHDQPATKKSRLNSGPTLGRSSRPEVSEQVLLLSPVKDICCNDNTIQSTNSVSKRIDSLKTPSFCCTDDKDVEMTNEDAHSTFSGSWRFDESNSGQEIGGTLNDGSGEVDGSGAEQFQCGKCGKKYTSNKSLWRHRKFACEGKQSFVCTVCGKHFSRSDNLRRHAVVAHCAQ